MKPIPLLLAVAAVAVGASAATRVLMDSGAPAPAADSTLDASQASLEKQLADLERQLQELQQSIGAVQQRLDVQAAPTAARVPSQSEVDAAVARWMAEHAPEGLASAPEEAASDMTVESALAELLSPTLSWEAREALWEKIRDAGLLDGVIAQMEAMAAANPGNPELQFALGSAYLQPIFAGESGPKAGEWATKSDEAFDRALAINPQYWEARFSKAVSLSFWPPVLGKQGEAIHQFELLLEQQGGSSAQEEYAQTYMFLGNLYQQTGNMERALEVWNQGLGLFPSNADLSRQIELANGGGN